MQYIATLQRNAYFKGVKQPKGAVENVTIGHLCLKDSDNNVLFECATLENGGASTDKSGTDRRIVARDYTLKWFDSTKNNNLAKRYKEFQRPNNRSLAIQLHTDAVQGFDKRYILIHIGNYAQDTEGCILLGEKGSGKGGVIGNSIMICSAFMRECQKIGIENIILRILENPNENL